MADELLVKEDREELVRMLRQMHQIRFFEATVMDLLAENYIQGGSHLYAGQEAVAVGACAALRPTDLISSTHRGHGHAIAKGGKLPELMAEICGKTTGCCKGKGGSLHLADLNTGNLGANGIVGGGFPIAVGAALSAQMRRSGQVVVCFFGDGAANEGTAHESMNMAATWRLPVVFVCENNLYGMSVAVSRCTNLTDLAERAKGYLMPSEIVDGMDVLAVKDAVARAAERARNGGGPTFIECKTYRYYGHSRSDPRVYRTKEEEAHWKGRDPIPTFARRLVTSGVITEAEAAEVEALAKRDVEEATAFARQSPYPAPEQLYEDLYA
ncbi:MAG: thiamine pyrophosphate-dependent dehydrogenase E1 component subunit alpha [Patescibacteria group bacterium]